MRTTTNQMLAGAVLGALALTLTAATARGQHGAHGTDGHLRAQACATEFDAVVADGRGFGMAFAADQNGYPGPMHVLELRERLGLTPEQAAKAERLMRAMFDESRPKARALADAETRLRRMFADAAADETRVRAAAAEVERARTEIRLVHLLTHLETRDLLTESQRHLYHEARWATAR
ncbi:MAG: periplasmic heavy metal sensor [Candidatus Rokubacteria bacterium]|nr:periplasmic heavy metal sensor [Candidatus Rokubacteria bacterium]